MKKIIRLTESDLNKIVKITINESLNQVAEDFRGTCRRVSSSLDDLDSELRKNSSKLMRRWQENILKYFNLLIGEHLNVIQSTIMKKSDFEQLQKTKKRGIK